ncbi:MAG: DUF4956 domain-containing protein [Firmicutes bacterium]|nr:DUF4956 domain-containing protein [Bacillota bacterium]
MFEETFKSLIEQSEITIGDFAVCSLVSIGIGIVISVIMLFVSKNKSKSMILTTALLPFVVQVIIMMVNGNIGIGLAVAGTFGLIRFRSYPGSADDLIVIFISMAVGLINGVGYIWVAIIFAVAALLIYIIYSLLGVGGDPVYSKELRVTIPENLNYAHEFDDIFEKYAKRYNLYRVKTTNFGSMYTLYYNLDLIDDAKEKDMIDEIRCRNGNLDIICGLASTNPKELL